MFRWRRDRDAPEDSKHTVGLLIVDLDNTLWDWVEVWAESFQAMLDELVKETGQDVVHLKSEIRRVHQKRGTTEYSFLLNELPSLQQHLGGASIEERFDAALHARNSKRYHLTKLYPGVLKTLLKVKEGGVTIVAYTESVAYWAEWRIRKTGLDGLIDYLYSAPDHDFPTGLSRRRVRTQPAKEYGLKKTVHLHVAKGLTKPNAGILSQIVLDHGILGLPTVYVGDSLSRDVAMAQEAGVIDVHAAYGSPQNKPGYALLTEVTQWTDEQVAAEFASTRDLPTPLHQLNTSLDELLDIFEFRAPERIDSLLEAWKQTVNVQQHFNDICWRIRGLAMTALTFILTAAYFLFTNLDPEHFDVGNSASLVCFLGLTVWCGFWFMDAAWYHRLLKGAVAEGELLERRLRGLGINVGLATRITHASHGTTPSSIWTQGRPQQTLIPRKAASRLHMFYISIGGVLLFAGIVLAFFI